MMSMMTTDDEDDEDDEDRSTTPGTLYFLSWNRVPAGQYVVTARATDSLGATTTSAPVSVTVRRYQPPNRMGSPL